MAFTMRDAQINLDSVWKSASKTSKKHGTGRRNSSIGKYTQK